MCPVKNAYIYIIINFKVGMRSDNSYYLIQMKGSEIPHDGRKLTLWFGCAALFSLGLVSNIS